MPIDLPEILRLLDDDARRTIYDHTEQDYPDECCGMVLDSGVRPCRNAQNDFHRDDPQQFPRTAANAWCFAVEDQFFLARSFDTGDPVRVIYHSHCDAPPNFSAIDHRGATFDDRPIYPDLACLVIACRRGVVTGACLYTWRDGVYHPCAWFAGRD